MCESDDDDDDDDDNNNNNNNYDDDDNYDEDHLLQLPSVLWCGLGVITAAHMTTGA